MAGNLYKRWAIESVMDALAIWRSVFIAGVRQCGKTTLARQIGVDGEIRSLDDSALLDVANQDNIKNLEAIKRLLQVSPGSTLLLRGHVDNARVADFRKTGGEAYALTCPLITKADGGKFGKTEKGNIWLDPERTSPYAFYQFWLNCSDEDSKRSIRIFTHFTKEAIESMEKDHDAEPHLRILQKALAKDLTVRVHSKEDYEAAVNASEILFGKGTAESLAALPEKLFLSVFEGVPQFTLPASVIENGCGVVDFLSEHT